MRSAFTRCLVGFAVVVILLVAMATPAFAASKPPSLSPEAGKHMHVGPNGFYCDPEWIYDNVRDAGSQIVIVAPSPSGPYPPDQPNGGPAYRSYNGTPYNATATFSATVTGTVALSTTVSGTVDASAIIAGVSGTLGITVTASLSTSVGHGINITVPPWKAGYGQYGVYRKVTTGHYYYLLTNCTVGTDYGTVTARSPWYPNWNTWVA